MSGQPDNTAASSAPDAEPLCPDWVFSSGSDVHVAKNRGWFTDYVPFTSTVGNGMEVKGIGTVELRVRRKANGSGPSAHGILRLVDVLHAPSVVCNIVGLPLVETDEVTVRFGGGSAAGFYRSDGPRLACFDTRRRLFMVRLSGPPVGPQVGPSHLEEGVLYYINACWTDSERRRWEAYKKRMASVVDQYTSEEKKWLKKHYGSEFKFLMTLGLKIFKDEDREEGRRIARMFMQDDE